MRGSVREAVLASRREAIIDARSPGAPRPVEDAEPPPAEPTERKLRPRFVALAVVLGFVGLIALAFWVKNARYVASPEGKVRESLIDWELTVSSQRDAVFLSIDELGPGAIPYVIRFLADPTPAERGESHSTRQLREIAHRYLMHLAQNLKVPPPKQADEIAKALFSGTTPPDPSWGASQDAWRAWVETQQAKGTLARP